MAVVSAFAQTLRRYTSLNHLAQAARAVLQNTSQINQMLSDLNRVDFANVQVKPPTPPLVVGTGDAPILTPVFGIGTDTVLVIVIVKYETIPRHRYQLYTYVYENCCSNDGRSVEN